MNPSFDLSSDTLSSTIIENCADAIIAQDLNGTVLTWNRAAEQLLGYASSEVIGTAPLLMRTAQVDEAAAIFQAAVAGNSTLALNTLRRHRNGRAVAVSLTASPLFDAEQRVIGVSSILRPASDTVVKAQQRLFDMAYRDSLTGLANRTQLLDRLDQAMKREERTHQYGAVLFMDLDRFKGVNDTAGHRTGDKILIRAARRMESRLRKCDTVARWGGDEFVVLIEDLSEDFQTAIEKGRVITKKLVNILGAPYQLEPRLHHCPASIGVAFFRGMTPSATAVIDRADRAMYVAKGNVSTRFHIDVVKPETIPLQADSVAA